jgi:hypothetical protein
MKSPDNATGTRVAYLVILDGQGETHDDYAVLRLYDTSPEGALAQALAPEMGYGRNQDGTAFVVDETHVSAFTVNDSTRRVAQPMTEPASL